MNDTETLNAAVSGPAAGMTFEDLAAAQEFHRKRVGTIACPARIGAITRTLEERIADPQYVEQQRRKRAERERAEAEQEQARREANWCTLAAKIGKRHANCTLDNFIAESDRQIESLRAMSRFVQQLHQRIGCGSNLLLYGPCGTGKDHLLVSLLRHAVLKVGASAVWVSGLDLWPDLRDLIGTKKREETLVRRLAEPDVLAISDPSSECDPLTPFQRAFLQRLIDHRYRGCNSTWLTINVSDRAAMEAAIGVPTVDRLGQDCLAIHCDWQSYRRCDHHNQNGTA